MFSHEFPSPRGVELHKPFAFDFPLFGHWELVQFPSPRGVELHKPDLPVPGYPVYISIMFPSPRGVELHKPWACVSYQPRDVILFPSPRGVELHKPFEGGATPVITEISFRPLAGLSCINLY